MLVNSLVVWWLGLCTFTAKGLYSVPGQEAAEQCDQKKYMCVCVCMCVRVCVCVCVRIKQMSCTGQQLCVEAIHITSFGHLRAA